MSVNEPPSTLVELSISCKKLKNMDVLSKSDPQVIMFVDAFGVWKEFGRSEIIWNNLNPKFTKVFRIKYQFEEVQRLKFVVVDIDDKNTTRLDKQDFIGMTILNLSEIVGAPGQVVSRYLQTSEHKAEKNRGLICIRAEEQSGTNDIVHIEVSASNLLKKSILFKNQPFLVISRASIEDTSMHPIFKSQVSKSSSSPKWGRFAIPLSKLCNGDYSRALKFEVFDHKNSGSHKLIGEFNTNLKNLLSLQRGQLVPILNVRKREKMLKKGKSYNNSGSLVIHRVHVEHVYTFLDYVSGGYHLNLQVAIDFTYSNKVPTDPSSLHYIYPNGRLNGYQKAILDVGKILLDYDSNKRVPVFGFGAKVFINGQYKVSHCFPCNFNWTNPEVNGLDGIMNAYVGALNNVQLYGPTNFSDIIRNAVTIARLNQTSYQILLILTDGEITDMQQTIDEIVDASKDVPLSIVIVGIGGSDFKNMHILDADTTPLISSRGVRMSRDIVQFVELKEFVHSQKQLAAEVLREIPSQFISYMKLRNIPPPKKIRMDSFQNMSFSSTTSQMNVSGPSNMQTYSQQPNSQYSPMYTNPQPSDPLYSGPQHSHPQYSNQQHLSQPSHPQQSQQHYPQHPQQDMNQGYSQNYSQAPPPYPQSQPHENGRLPSAPDVSSLPQYWI